MRLACHMSPFRELLSATAFAFSAALLLAVSSQYGPATSTFAGPARWPLRPVAGEGPRRSSSWPVPSAAAEPWYSQQLRTFSSLTQTLSLLNSTASAACEAAALDPIPELPAPDPEFVGDFKQSANLSSQAASYCTSLVNTLYLMASFAIPALNASMPSAAGAYGNPGPYGSPTNATQPAYTNATQSDYTKGTTSAAAYPPQCRTLQGLMTLWTHAFVGGGLRMGCWRAAANSYGALQLVPACGKDTCLAVTSSAQDVALALWHLGTSRCGGDLPGEWGQPYGAEAEVLPTIARTQIGTTLYGRRHRRGRQLLGGVETAGAAAEVQVGPRAEGAESGGLGGAGGGWRRSLQQSAGPTANGTNGTNISLSDASPAGGGRTLRLRPLVWYNDSNGVASYRNIAGSFTYAAAADFSRPPFEFMSFFGDTEAQVVCRSLGYPGGGLAYDSALPNSADGLAGFLPYYYSCSTGLEPDLGQCNATSLSTSSLVASSTVAAAGVLCFPTWNATEYCSHFTSQFPSLLSDSAYPLQSNGTQTQQPPSYGSPAAHCSALLSQAADVDTLAFQRFPGQPLPLEQAVMEPCFNATVRPALVGWMQRWLSAVQQDNCSLVPYSWMPYVSQNINRGRNSTCPVAMASWPTAALPSPTNSTNSTFTFMNLDSRMVPTPNSVTTSTSNTSSGGSPTSTALNTDCAAPVPQNVSSTTQAMNDTWFAFGPHGGGPWTELLSLRNLLSFRGNATAFAHALKSAAPPWAPGRLTEDSHVANVLAAFSRPGGLQFALNTTVDTASAAAFRASTPLLGSEVRQLLPPPPLQYACLGYDPSWMSSYGTQDRDVLAFLNSSSAVSKSGSGGLPVWGRAADRQELERCAGTGEVVQALYSIVGFSMCGMGLTSRQRYDRDAGQLLPTLFRGATNSNTNGSYSTSAAPYPGDPVIPAANLAYLDMSGNLLFGGLPLLPLPALLVNLSRTGLGGPLVDAFGATQQSPTSPFPFALVVDLSGNVLSSPLPSGFSRSSSWGALLDTAVFIDLSDNKLTGTLPGDEWAFRLKEVDIVLAGNPGLQGPVPQSWLALSSEPGWGPGGRMLDFTRCSGLEQRLNSVPEYSLLRVSGTSLLLDWGLLQNKDWSFVVDRVARGHMEFQQVHYSRPRQVSDVIPGMGGVLDPNDVAKICNCIDGRDCPTPAVGQAWPVVLNRSAVNQQYSTWQQDPSMWCQGGRAQRFRVAVRVWAPTLAVVLLALLSALPLYNLRTRIVRRRQARRAQRQQQQQWQQQQRQQQWQQSLGHEAQKQEDGKPSTETATGDYLPGRSVPAARLHNVRYHAARCWSCTQAAAVATWRWLVVMYDLLEPRLVVVLYWVDLISDLVFIVGYKGWGKQPAPAIAVLIIILGNMVLFWVLHLLSERKDVGWSRRRCWCVGLLTAPFGIVLELLWHFLLAVVVVGTFPFAAWNRRRWGGLHAALLGRLTRSWPHLLRYEAHAHTFEHSVLLEPVTESLPQLLVQTVCYVIGREAGLIILTPIYLFSATLSAISICKASLYLAWRVLLCGSWSKVLLNRDDADSLFTPPLSTVLSKSDADPGDKATASGELGFPADGQPPPPPEGSPVVWGASGYPPINIINRGRTASSEVSSGTRTSSGPSPRRSSPVGPHADYTTTTAAIPSPPGLHTPPRFYPQFAPRLDAHLQLQPSGALPPAASGLYPAVMGYPPPHESEEAAAPCSTAARGPPQPLAAIPPWVGPLHQGLRAGPPPAPLQPPPLPSAPSFQKARILPKKQRRGQQPQDQASPCVSLTPLLGVELTDTAQAAQAQQGVAPSPAATMYPPPPPTLHGAPPPPPYQAPYGRDGQFTGQELPSLAAGTSGTAAVALPHPCAPPPSASGRAGPVAQQEVHFFALGPTAAPAWGDTPFVTLQQQQQSCPPIDGGAPQAVPGSSAGGSRPPPPPPPPAFLHDDE